MVRSRKQRSFMTPSDWLDAKGRAMLMLGMILLGLVTFAAMLGFVTLCDRV